MDCRHSQHGVQLSACTLEVDSQPAHNKWIAGTHHGVQLCGVQHYNEMTLSLHTIKRIAGTPTMDYSYVESNATEAPFFASKVKLSTEGACTAPARVVWAPVLKFSGT